MLERLVLIVAAAVSSLALTGCASARLPLCPKIAAVSFQGGARTGAVVNNYLAAQGNERNVKISPISAFAATFHGSVFSIAWFQGNYAFMLCAFDPKQVVNYEAVYLSCMSHAPEWVKIVQSSKPEDLMVTQTHYADVCIP
jgi:hypothetical protein